MSTIHLEGLLFRLVRLYAFWTDWYSKFGRVLFRNMIRTNLMFFANCIKIHLKVTDC